MVFDTQPVRNLAIASFIMQDVDRYTTSVKGDIAPAHCMTISVSLKLNFDGLFGTKCLRKLIHKDHSFAVTVQTPEKSISSSRPSSVSVT